MRSIRHKSTLMRIRSGTPMGVMLASQDSIQLTPPRIHNDPPRKRSYSLSSDVCLDNRQTTTGRRLIGGEFFFFLVLFFFPAVGVFPITSDYFIHCASYTIS